MSEILEGRIDNLVEFAELTQRRHDSLKQVIQLMIDDVAPMMRTPEDKKLLKAMRYFLDHS